MTRFDFDFFLLGRCFFFFKKKRTTRNVCAHFEEERIKMGGWRLEFDPRQRRSAFFFRSFFYG